MDLPPLRPNYQSPWTSAPTPEHLEQIATARRLGIKIRRAVNVATFSGWATGLFAGLSLLVSAAGDRSLPGLGLGMGMAVVAFVELRGAGEIKRLDRTAPRRLAINQIAFGALLFAYGAISLWSSLHAAPSPELAEISRSLPGLGDLEKSIYVALYSGVMVIAVIEPGLTAWYYSSRARFIDAYITQTPQWILDLQRAGMSV